MKETKFKQTEIGGIPEDWSLIKLKPFLKIAPRNGVYKVKEEQGKGTDIVKMGTLFANFFIDNQEMEKFELNEKEKKMFLLEKGDLVFARTSLILEGVGKCAIMDTDSREVAFESNTFRIRLDKNKINPKYILYFFRSHIGRHFIGAIASQTAATSIKSSDLVNISLPLPNKDEQDRTTKLLYDLDMNIRLLKKMNKTLEVIGQALFKHWFIDFEFPDKGCKPYKSNGGEMIYSEELDKEIPVRWKERLLSDLVEISTDTVRPKDELYYHYSIPSFDENKFPNLENGNLIKSNKYIVKKNSILLSKLNPRFYRLWLPFDNFNNSICSTEFIVFIPKFDNSKAFCFFLLNSKYMRNQLISHATGTTGSRQRVKPKDTLKFELVVPPKEIIQKFNDTTSPLLLKFLNNRIESRYLESIRNILLPKLMSGKIRVNVSEIRNKERTEEAVT